MGIRANVALAAAALAFGIVAACESFQDAAVSETDAGDAADGGVDAVDEAAPPLGDAAMDAADARVPFVPCAARDGGVLLCDDFEHGGPIEARWTGILGANGATADYFAGGLASPKAFISRLPAGSGTLTRAQLYKDFMPVPASRFRLSFAARVDALPHPVDGGTSGFAHLAVFEFMPDAPCMTSSTSSSRAVELTLSPPNIVRVITKGLEKCVDGGLQPFSSTPLEKFASDLTGSFHQFEVEMSHVACPNTTVPFALRVTIDGESLYCHPFDENLFATTKVRIEVGASAGGGAFRDTTYVYDDVTIDGE